MPTQSTDLLANGTFAIFFAEPGLKWKVATGVTVGSSGSVTIASSDPDSTLVNKGLIINTTFGGQSVLFTGESSTVINKGQIVGGPSGFGIQLVGDDHELINEAGATVLGGNVGVSMNGGLANEGGYVENHGRIAGTDDFSFGIRASGLPDFVLKNYSEIEGEAAGLRLDINDPATTPGPKIVNHGLIRGDNAIDVSLTDDEGYRLKLVNKADGKIIGESAAVISLSVQGLRMVIKNEGLIDGDILTEKVDFNDKIVNTGKIKGNVFLREGDDLVDNTDGRITKKIFGEEGNDTFILGDKRETIVFDSDLFQNPNVDTIHNFETGTDRLFLDQAVFAKLPDLGELAKANFRKGTEAQDADDFILYDKPTGVLAYDVDGSGLDGVAVPFAQFDAGTGLKHTDFTVFA
ncbi:hypothetical protein [Bauldia sp.]|uniref:hypothetical protein n=1 Tax=Bauldia sp. TaxID=2575872 RepID=UPI003BA86E0C